jgi:hypothetical protein
MDRMKLPCALAAVLLLAPPLLAQQKNQAHPAQAQAFHDDLDLTCTQILAMGSADYIAKVTAIDDSNVDLRLRGIGNFGRCYDERIARLAASLARRGIGPKKSALTDLADLEQKLDAFTTTTLADTAQPTIPLKKVYAELYEKQFRYAFYESYEPRSAKPKTQPKPAATHAATATRADGTAAMPGQGTTAPATPNPAATPKPVAPPTEDLPSAPVRTIDLGSATPAKTVSPPPSAPAPAAPPPGAKDPSSDATTAPPAAPAAEVDPFTKAKNHFGELLGLLPPEKIHEVHSSFGKLFSGNPVSEDLKVDIYKYAIFLLEGPKDQPFAPPPF